MNSHSLTARIWKPFYEPIDSHPGQPVRLPYLTYRPTNRARICKPIREPRNRFPAWQAGTTFIFVVPACQATKACGIQSSESIPGLHNR